MRRLNIVKRGAGEDARAGRGAAVRARRSWGNLDRLPSLTALVCSSYSRVGPVAIEVAYRPRSLVALCSDDNYWRSCGAAMCCIVGRLDSVRWWCGGVCVHADGIAVCPSHSPGSAVRSSAAIQRRPQQLSSGNNRAGCCGAKGHSPPINVSPIHLNPAICYHHRCAQTVHKPPRAFATVPAFIPGHALAASCADLLALACCLPHRCDAPSFDVHLPRWP